MALLVLLLHFHSGLSGVIETNNQDLLRPREGRTIGTNSTSDFFNDLSRLLQGTASLLRTIVEAKQETVAPLVTGAIAAKTSLVQSPIVKSAVEAKMAVVKSLADATPALTRSLGGVVNAVASAAPALLKSGLCNVVCPLTGQEECKKEHCEEAEAGEVETASISPRQAKDLDSSVQLGDYDYQQPLLVRAAAEKLPPKAFYIDELNEE